MALLGAGKGLAWVVRGREDDDVTGGPGVPSAPAIVTVTAQTTIQITVVWSFVATATKFDVYRALTSGGSFSVVGNDIADLTFIDTTVVASTAYFYKVKAINGDGESAFSSEVTTATPTVADSVRTLLRKAVKFGLQQIIKNNNSGDGYIYKNTFRDFGDPNKNLQQITQLPYVGIDFGRETNSNTGRGQAGDGNQAKLLNSVILQFTCLMKESNAPAIPTNQEGVLNDLQARFGNNFGVPDATGSHRAFNSLYLGSEPFGLKTNAANANCGVIVEFTVWYRQQLTNPNNQV